MSSVLNFVFKYLFQKVNSLEVEYHSSIMTVVCVKAPLESI